MGPILKAALQRSPSDPKLLSLLALQHEIIGDMKGAENALLKAIQHARDLDRGELAVRLGSLYRDLQHFSEAADQFSEVIGQVPEHPLAINLLACLVNSKRLREALSWARKIRRAHAEPPRLAIEVEAQILGRIGDVRGALKYWKKLCSRSDAVPADLVKVAEYQYGCGERLEASKTVRRIKATDLCNNPRSMIVLAQLKLLLGEPGSLDDAYLARRYGITNPEVQLGYCGVFLSRDKGWVEPDRAGPGCSVLLRGESSERWWLILDNYEESLNPYEIPQTHPPARELLGHGVGDTIVLREGLETLSYEIVAIQSKFVRAFQETIAEFSTRFPEHKGMYRVNFKNGDFSPLFHSVDERYRLGNAVEELYLEGRIPFVSFCSIMGRSVPEVWSACTESGFISIRFGKGSNEGAMRAGELLKDANEIVLDAVALLTVHRLGLAEQLCRRFSQVRVPQQVVHELQQEYAMTVMASRPAGWLGKNITGQYSLSEISEEDWGTWREYLLSVLELAESFEQMPSHRLLDIDDLDKFVDAFTEVGVATAYVGDEETDSKRLLLCDDFLISEFARSIGTESVNTQAVLIELHSSGFVTSEEYSKFVEQLVLLNYRFVQIRSEDIIRRLEASGFATTNGTRAMLKTLEGPECRELSALSVAADLLVKIAGKVLPGQTELILSMIVATLKRGRDPTQVLAKFRGELASRLALAPITRDRLMKSVDLYMQI